jgi:hypothetical protein
LQIDGGEHWLLAQKLSGTTRPQVVSAETGLFTLITLGRANSPARESSVSGEDGESAARLKERGWGTIPRASKKCAPTTLKITANESGTPSSGARRMGRRRVSRKKGNGRTHPDQKKKVSPRTSAALTLLRSRAGDHHQKQGKERHACTVGSREP